MVRLRLKRFGHRNHPFYRIAAFDARAARDSRSIDESLGHYDPLEPDDAKKVTLNRERVLYWLDRGAQPSQAVNAILKRNGIHVKFTGKARRRKKRRLRKKHPSDQNA